VIALILRRQLLVMALNAFAFIYDIASAISGSAQGMTWNNIDTYGGSMQ
jgi:hypothetical protein